MKFDANATERDEFDGDPLNPKHIESTLNYLDMSPRDNLKKAAAEIIRAQAKRVQNLEMVSAQAYQVIGILSDECGRFNDNKVVKMLDNLSDHEPYWDVLPFPSKKPSLYQRILACFK